MSDKLKPEEVLRKLSMARSDKDKLRIECEALEETPKPIDPLEKKK